MNFQKTLFITIVFVAFHSIAFCQKELYVNGKPINNTRCVEIKINSEDLSLIKEEAMPEILDATITDDCLEVTLQHAGCGGNIELITDNKINSSSKAKMNFKFNWIEKPTCNEKQQILVTFDLAPHKKIIQDNKAVIYILGTGIVLKYKN
ncbi:MAG: hypothetical protein KAZ71_05960 [Bacteroidia bacterium]|nr:hypothetical protein [Bacteroidia bacterium]